MTPYRSTVIALVMLSTSLWTPGLSAASLPKASFADLCFGQTPTIVGIPGELVFGTEGPDVVVTNGAFGARTLGGDDLLCITGVAPVFDPPAYVDSFDTGKGDDRVDATGGTFPYSLTIFPGPGADEVVAGPHTLDTGETAGVTVYATDGSRGGDADLIRTGDGPDYVEAEGQDVVDLGGDDDTVSIWEGHELSGGVFNGGAGRNDISISLWTPFWHPTEYHSWKINNRAGRLARDGEIVARMSGFSDFDVHAKGPLRFVGSNLPETFNTTGLAPEEPLGAESRHHWPLVLEMHGGDDVAVYYRGGPDSRFDGGGGTDRFSFADDIHNCFFSRCLPDEALLDLSTGRLRHSSPDGREVRTQVVNFEDVRWWSRADGTIIGTDGPNRLVTRAHKPGRDITMIGAGGDDFLRGGLGRDVLIGGGGHDLADGQGGEFDRCRAEVRTHCEA